MATSKSQRDAIKQRDGKCYECDSTENLTVDHIIPLSRGGYDIVENLRTLCLSCNKRKASMINWRWYQKLIHALSLDSIVEKLKNELRGEISSLRGNQEIKIGSVTGHLGKLHIRVNDIEKQLKDSEKIEQLKTSIENQTIIISHLLKKIGLLEKYLKIEFVEQTLEVKEYRKLK